MLGERESTFKCKCARFSQDIGVVVGMRSARGGVGQNVAQALQTNVGRELLDNGTDRLALGITTTLLINVSML